MMHSPEAPLQGQEQAPRYFLEVGTHSSPVLLVGRRRFVPNERYIGIDINLEEVQAAANTAKIIQRDSGERMLFINADGRRLPLADGSIHEALLSNVLGDPKTRDHGQLIAQLYRVLANGGALVIAEFYTPGVAPEHRIVALCEKNGFALRRLTKPSDSDWNERAGQYGNLAVQVPEETAYVLEFEKITHT